MIGDFERTIRKEKWYSYSTFGDISKIKQHIPTLSYLVNEDSNLKNYCTEKVFKHSMGKPNFFESKNIKNLIRNGVPLTYMRDFLLKIYEISDPTDSFNTKYTMTFKERDSRCIGDFVPYFTGFDTLQESLPINFLSQDGLHAVKEIMWLLNSVIPNIEHSPTIIKLVSLFLIFLDKAETYEIMRNIIETNCKVEDTFKIRWHIRFTYNDNMKIVTSILESFKYLTGKNGKEIVDHLDSINFPIERLFEDILYNFFFDYLNFSALIKLLPFFMIEGVKALYRISFAFLETLKPEILKIKKSEDVLIGLKVKGKEITDITKFFNLAYSYSITRNNNKYAFQNLPEISYAEKRNLYYLPSFSVTSSILKESEISKIWSILPRRIRIYDAKMIFNTESHGYSLSNIYALANEENKNDEILFLIETAKGDIVGGFMTCMFRLTNRIYDRPFESYFLTVRPETEIYSADPNSDDIIYCDNDCFMFGGGSEGPALRVDKDLKSGFSKDKNSFDSPMIGENGEFTVVKMEIYKLG